MAAAIHRNELLALESLARAQSASASIDEGILTRLAQLGMAEENRGRWQITKRGTLELQRRKALGRTTSTR